MSFCKNRFCASAFYFQLCMLCISGTNVKLSMMTRHDSVYSYANSGNLTWRCARCVILRVLMYIKGLNRFRYHIQRTPLCHQPLCHTVRSYLWRIYYAYWMTFLMPESLFPGPGVFRISVSSTYFNPKHLRKILW